MRNFWFPLILTGMGTCLSFSPCWGEEEGKAFSGEISVEPGIFQGSDCQTGVYQFSRFELESHQDLITSLSYGFEGQAEWQTSSILMNPPDHDFGVENILPFEVKDENGGFFSMELYQASLKFAQGPVEFTAGLFKPSWGSSRFYKPTDYFYPLQPLQWNMEIFQGSEGLDAKSFLFDDLSLEGAVRWLEDWNSEWVLKLVNKGIGITATPSFARLLNKNAMGLELSGTFPDFQLRAEGVDWFFNDGSAKAEWTIGISTVRKSIAYTLEILRDETGTILGGVSAGAPNATYLYTSMEKTFQGDWKISPALVKGFEGGPFLFWPKASWGFAPSWELELQGQVKLGTVPGPLSLVQNRLGISTAFSF